ncbi:MULTISPECIES: zinc ABC transporter substrate-binding protein AztC [Mesorhizobium]|uniref:Metal ABC transporter substrate-binding protein n=1 Tax=Mesorhizobium denitrificans TaxID=2294114 RepID=A0A371XII7_9HYPH|nr:MULTISPECIES: zinc ABC transporter substrate-binding protein AztC [Mesorhizobium]RFC69027.1 metal ABC transporter substrate-binding protein [Mesorhizobium denitrificans]
MKSILRYSACAAALAFALPASAQDKLNVVASFSIIGDFAKQVGGNRIELTTLVGPGGDAHVYEPKPADAAAMQQANVVLVNGLHFEGFLQRLVDSSATKASVVELTKGVETIEAKGDEEPGHHHDGIDPHAFQSIANAEIYVANIAGAFCVADAAGCDTYKANAAAYTITLEALDDEVKAAIASIPADKRTIITSHDAFGYFENAYGIRFLAPEGISTESEASAADVAKLVRQVREDKASAIFVENITDPRLSKQIADETGLKIGGTLYSDALSDANGPASTYFDMMRHNVSTIKGAVLGS